MAAPLDPEETSLIVKGRSYGITDQFEVQSSVCPVLLKELISSTGLVRGFERAALQELAKIALRKEANGKYTVLLGEKKTACGRAYALDYKKASAVTMRSVVRGALFGAKWCELDIEACHPAILRSLAAQRGISTPVLTKYLAERKAWLKGVAQAFRCSEGHAKQCFNAAIYGSNMQVVEGQDGVRREIHTPWSGSDQDEEYRVRLHDFITEVKETSQRLLADPVIQRDHVENLKLAKHGREASKLFKLLEVGERCAIRALQMAIEATAGKVIQGEVIYDGLLFQLSEGGPPAQWDVTTLCADASARAKDLFALEVSFKAKPLAAGDIFPEGQDGDTTALLDKGCVWYAPLKIEHELKAKKRAIAHAKKREHRFVLALQTKLGVRYAALPDWESLQQKLHSKDGCVWETPRAGVPVRPWVCFEGCDEDIPDFQDAMRKAAASFFSEEVAEASTFTATVEGASRFALIMQLKGHFPEDSTLEDASLEERALEDVNAAAAFNCRAFNDTPLLAKVLSTTRLVMVGHAPLDRPNDKRLLLTPGATTESTFFTAPKGARTLPIEGMRPATPEARESWGEDYLTIVNQACPELVDEKVLCDLVIAHCSPGDTHRNLSDQRAVKSVARALWATCREEEESHTADRFIKWATEDGASASNTRGAMEALWEENTTLSGQDSGQRDIALAREMIDILRDRTPELHAAFVTSTARSLTGGPAPGVTAPPFITVRHLSIDPGRNSIGSQAELLSQYKYLGTRAQTGFGKTEADLATIRESSPGSALVVTTRRSVAASMTVRYNGDGMHIKFWHYQDESFDCDPGARRDVDHLICELESLGTLGRAYKHLYLDEFTSILMQMASEINRTRYKRLCAAVKELTRSAQNVSIADALLTMTAFERFVNIVEGPGHSSRALFTVCTPVAPSGRSAVFHTKQGGFKADELEAAFKGRFHEGHERIFCFTNIKKMVPEVVKAFTVQWRNHQSQGGNEDPGDPRVLRIDASTPIPKGMTTDEWWSGYDLVIVTPTITNSVSFGTENYFHCSMAFCSNMSCIPPDVMQGCGRVRHPASKTVHVYIAVSFSGTAAAVKSHNEMVREAEARDRTATHMERLCYSLAGTASLFSFNFFEEYLSACFKANGYIVSRAETVMQGSRALEKAIGQPIRAFDEVHRIAESEFSGVVRRTCDSANFSDEDAAVALGIIGAPNEEGEGGRARLRLIRSRHLFACKLLNIEHPADAARDLPLDEGGVAARNSLWESFNKDQGPLWTARKAFLYEHYSPKLGSQIGGIPERLQTDFANSAVMPWHARFRDLRKALGAVGLTTAIPSDGPECEVSRDRLAAGYADLAALVPSANQSFNRTIKKPEHAAAAMQPEEKVEAAATILKAIVGSWNPMITFKASGARKRARTADGGRAQTTPYVLTYKRDSNLHGEMQLLHSINLKD